MGELDENARREIEDALQSEALSNAERSEVADMITTAVKAAFGNTEPQIADLKRRVNNLTESLQEVVGDNKRLQVEFANSRSEGGDDVSPPALDLRETYLMGGCRCYYSRERYKRIICDHMKVLYGALTTARLAGAKVFPPDLPYYCKNCTRDQLTQWEAVCDKCQAVGILGTLG